MADNPIKSIVGFIGLISSCIGIYVFVSGNQNIQSAFETSSDTNYYYEEATDEPAFSFSNLFISPTPVPKIPPDTFPSWFLPDESDIDPNWVETENKTITNEDLAKSFDDPSDVLLTLDSFGRVTGQSTTYTHNQGCDYHGVQYIGVSVAVYETSSGASKSIKWFSEKNKETGVSQNKYYEVGDEATTTWFETQNGCETPDDVRDVNIRFRKYNISAVVYISSVKNSVSDDELLELALYFAKRIELNITSFVLNN